MKYFKISRTWAVKAADEQEALTLNADNPSEYLDSETVIRTEYKKPQGSQTSPQQQTGWGQAVKDQVFGTQSNRSR
jgi:hypothetical protein